MLGAEVVVELASPVPPQNLRNQTPTAMEQPGSTAPAIDAAVLAQGAQRAQTSAEAAMLAQLRATAVEE